MKKSTTANMEVIPTFFNDLLAAQSSPRFQIIVTNSILELLVNVVVELSLKNGKRILESDRDYPYSVKLLLLNEKGVIEDDQYRWLDTFRKLRNDAAHAAQFHFTAEMVKPFKDMPGPDPRIKMDDPNPEKFVLLCLQLVVAFWNKYKLLLQPHLEPEIYAEEVRQKQINDSLQK